MNKHKGDCPDKAKHTTCPDGYIQWREWVAFEEGEAVKIMEVKLIFEPRDLWIGLYWDKSKMPNGGKPWLLTLYFCFIPMLPIRIKIWQSGIRTR